MQYLITFCSLFFVSLLFAQNPKGYSGTFFLSKDKGETWKRADRGIPSVAIVNAMVEKGDLIFLATESHGIYASSDPLTSWNSANQGLTAKKIDALYEYGGKLFAGTYQQGVFKSDDEGLTWNPLNEGLTNLTIRAFFAFNGMLFTGTNEGVFVLKGNNWHPLKGGFQINDFEQLGDKLFVATNKGVLYSDASLSLWKMILVDIAVYKFSKVEELLEATTYFSERIKIDERGHVRSGMSALVPKIPEYSMIRWDDFILLQKPAGLFKSYDGGRSWQEIKIRGIEAIGLKDIRKTNQGLIAFTGKEGC